MNNYCPICGKRIYKTSKKCCLCNLKSKNKGFVIRKDGRKLIYMPEHPNIMRGGYVLNSRLVMETKMGRYLTDIEIVHHLDFNKSNDNLDNLYLFKNQSEHIKYHKFLRKIVMEELGTFKTKKEYAQEYERINRKTINKKAKERYHIQKKKYKHICEECQKEYISIKKIKFCSSECREKYKKRWKKEYCHNWWIKKQNINKLVDVDIQGPILKKKIQEVLK